MKRKKLTRAYKEGFSAGEKGKNHNLYTEGSTRYNDYERGFSDAKSGTV